MLAVPALGGVGGHPPSASRCLAVQVGSAGKSSAQVDGNSSLVFRPLVKEQHGVWECTATNRVASVSTATSVHVLGESPVPGGQMPWVLGCPGVDDTSSLCWKGWKCPCTAVV